MKAAPTAMQTISTTPTAIPAFAPPVRIVSRRANSGSGFPLSVEVTPGVVAEITPDCVVDEAAAGEELGEDVAATEAAPLSSSLDGAFGAVVGVANDEAEEDSKVLEMTVKLEAE